MASLSSLHVTIFYPSGENLTDVMAYEWPRRSGNIPKFKPERLALVKLVFTKKQFLAITLLKSAPSKLVLWKSPFEMFAPLIEVLLKSFPLKFMLHPTSNVIEFEERVIAFLSLTFLVERILPSSVFSNR